MFRSRDSENVLIPVYGCPLKKKDTGFRKRNYLGHLAHCIFIVPNALNGPSDPEGSEGLKTVFSQLAVRFILL